MSVLVSDYKTIHEAAAIKCTKPDTLHKWIKRHNVQVEHVGRSLIVRLSALEGYERRDNDRSKKTAL